MDISKNTNIEESIKKAQAIYENLGVTFEKENNGKFIAIDIDSGEYFVGETREEAVNNANKKLPGKLVFTRRIGTIEKVASNSPLSFNRNLYACLL